MTAGILLEKNLRYDRSGKPLEVVVPYDQFIEFIEDHGLDLSDEDKAGLRGAIADCKADKRDAFVSLEDIKKEFGCTQ
jgi:hypothetical protein